MNTAAVPRDQMHFEQTAQQSGWGARYVYADSTR
jgi:hypothetical protein